MSPGRARSNAASIAARRSAIDQQVVVAPLADGLRATRDLVQDGVAVLAARILVGDHDDPGALAGDPAHRRPLGGVAFAGRAEDRDQAAAARGGQRGEQVEDGLQGDRAVGEVDDDPERLAELDALHPPGDERDRREAFADGRRVKPDRLAERDDRQGVVDVEPPDELEVHGRGARRRVVGDAQPPRVLLDAGRPDVGCRVGAVGHHPGARLLGDADERAGRRVVGVDDAGRRPAMRLRVGGAGPLAAARQLLEQAQLGVAVRLPRPVQLEVLVRQVGQDRDVVGDGVDPREGEAMRGRLDDRGRIARARTMARRARWSSGASGVVACASLGDWTPPIRVAAVPVMPVRIPAASSAATARNEVVVLPSVPVIPTTASSSLGSPYHQAAAVASASRVPATTSCGSVIVGEGVVDQRGGGPGRGGRLDEVVAVRVEPRDGHEQRPRADGP